MTNIAPTPSPLGTAVATRMASLGLAQMKLAKAASVPQASISDLVNGKVATLKLDNVQALAGALETTVGELLGEPAQSTPAGEAAAILVPLDKLFASPLNPRKQFDDAALQQLAESLANLGMLQPVTARARPDGRFEVVLGGRRLRAAAINAAAGTWPTDHPIPVALVEADDVQALEMATAENVQRADMHPLEEADAFVELRRCDVTTEAISAAVGKTQRWVQERLRIGENLDAKAREAFLGDKLTLAMARELSRAPAAVQAAAMVRIEEQIERGWGVNADTVRRIMADPFPPVSDAAFDLSAYTGEMIAAGDPEGDDPDPERFADVAQFKRLQWEAINRIEAKLLKKYGWVDRREEHEYWEPVRYTGAYQRAKPADDAERGAVIRIHRDTMAVKVFKNLYRTPQRAADSETETDARPKDPVEKLTGARRVLARNVKTRVLQTALMEDVSQARAAIEICCVSLMGGRQACRVHSDAPDAADRGVIAPAVLKALDDAAEKLNAGGGKKIAYRCDGHPWLRMSEHFYGTANHDEKLYAAVRALPLTELHRLFTALVAAQTGSFAGYGGTWTPVGDEPMAVAIAEALQVDTTDHWRMDADYLAKLTKAELLALGPRIGLFGGDCVDDGRAWRRMKTVDLRDAILNEITANDVRHVPAEMRILGKMAAEAGIRREAKEAGG